MKKTSVDRVTELADLFCPEFVTIKDCVFFKREHPSKSIDTSYPSTTESDSSHTHILDFLEHKAGSKREPFFRAKHPDFKTAYKIGRRICLMWALKLMHDYPRDNFRVYLHGFDPIVRFHKVRKGIPNLFEAKDCKKEIESGEVMIVDTRDLRKKRGS